MPTLPEDLILSICDQAGMSVGTGFMATESLVTTCAHVINSAGSGPGDDIQLHRANGDILIAKVLPEYWRSPVAEDVAILRLSEILPNDALTATFGETTKITDHNFRTFGFPDVKGIDGLIGTGVILGKTTIQGWPVLQLRSKEVTPGFSGAPIFDINSRRVVGMVTAITPPDDYQRLGETAFATPSEVLASICPEIKILAPESLSPYQDIFRMIVQDKTEGFVGREYVFTAIDKFLSAQTKGYYIIEGDPGMGKSTFLAEYVRRKDYVAHFNTRLSDITRTRQFLESLTQQLSVRYGLSTSEAPKDPAEFGPFLIGLLQNASSHLKAGERLVIAVDALDEVASGDLPIGRNILCLPPLLPDGVYFVLTQRRGANLPFLVHSPTEIFDLLKHPAEGREDVLAYLDNAVKNPGIHGWIAGRSMTTDEFIQAVADKSENNFMYLHYIILDMANGRYGDFTLEDVPTGLKGYYETHWALMGMQTKPLPTTKIKIIYILAEVRQPVSRSLIAEFAKENELTVQEVLDEWEQFLHRHHVNEQTRHSVYHASFREFLHRKDIVQAAGVTVEGINGLIDDGLSGLYD
jgi:hypothetical protein